VPLISGDPQQALDEVRSAVSTTDEEQLLNFVLQQGLGPLWHEALKQSGSVSFLSDFTDTVKKATLFATAFSGQTPYPMQFLKVHIFGNSSTATLLSGLPVI
jgi:hypothetical protein